MRRSYTPCAKNQEGECCAAQVANKSGLILRMTSGESDPGTKRGWVVPQNKEIEVFREGDVDFQKVIQPILLKKNQCNSKFCGFS